LWPITSRACGRPVLAEQSVGPGRVTDRPWASDSCFENCSSHNQMRCFAFGKPRYLLRNATFALTSEYDKNYGITVTCEFSKSGILGSASLSLNCSDLARIPTQKLHSTTKMAIFATQAC